MARILDQIHGHTTIVNTFLHALATGRLPSTFLLVGPSGIGKRMTAWGFAQALLCERGIPACGECPTCIRVEKRACEGVLAVTPEGTQIKVEQGREVLEFLSLRRLGRARVVIMDQAHLLNVQAGNSLLKTLEEPPEATYFFLITSSLSAILPTIRSRAQTLRFAPLSHSDLRALVPAPDWVLASAQGRVELARQFEDEAWAAQREGALTLLFRTLNGEGVEAAAVKEAIKDKTMALFTTLVWQQMIRDICVAQVGASTFANLDHAQDIQHFARLHPRAMNRLAERAFELDSAIHGNVDRQLVVENFLIDAAHVMTTTDERELTYGLD